MCKKDTEQPPHPVWIPSKKLMEQSQMARFMRQAGEQQGREFTDYGQLWEWSVTEPVAFWSALWRFCDVVASREWDELLQDGNLMPGARWFIGARLNFAENLLRFRDDHPALICIGEEEGGGTLQYTELYHASARLAAALCQLGIKPGDRVAAILPNIPHTVIGMLATSWLGAVWSSCSPDFGSEGIVDRFGQIEPKLLIVADGYRYKGRSIDIRDKINRVRAGLPGCEHCLFVSWQGTGEIEDAIHWESALDNDYPLPPFTQLPFDHPLAILFSSGTTGKPKCIVHGAGGTLLQHLKEHRLHTDIRREDRLFYFTTCGWMMWNWLVSGLASGATLILYDGNPMYPLPDRLWRVADDIDITVFGTSAKYITAQQKADVTVKHKLPLSKLRTLLSTGSPLAPEAFDYIHQAIKPGLQISSISGGTDIISCFALGNPMLPVYRGQLQCRGLGMAVDVYDAEGTSLYNQSGEMVCKKPFPSMPVGFWNDSDGRRYRAAYFERFTGVWTHGDWTRITGQGGLIIEGRSDTVLNPGGVRIGTAEIYRQVERLPQVKECVCVGQKWDDDVRVVLFVVLQQELVLNEELRQQINDTLRINASPRHVPSKVIQVNDVPRTRNGKVSEIAVRDTIEGRAVANTESLINPDVLIQYRNLPELAVS
ncbi:MAG: acetoacetate--CoA ligase [Candidatus Thiodiazotropha endolucinida]